MDLAAQPPRSARETFAAVVRRARGEGAVEAFVREQVAGRSREAIEAWNREFLRYEPDLTRPNYRDAVEALRRRAPGRSDITLWVDLTDVEEGRPVPTPEEVRARRAALSLAT